MSDYCLALISDGNFPCFNTITDGNFSMSTHDNSYITTGSLQITSADGKHMTIPVPQLGLSSARLCVSISVKFIQIKFTCLTTAYLMSPFPLQHMSALSNHCGGSKSL